MAEPSKGMGLIIGIGKPKAGGESESGEGPKELAAKSLIKAVKSGDVAGVVDAYELLRDACDDEYEEESEEGESEM